MGAKDNLFHILGLKTTDGLAFKDFVRVNVMVHENYSMFGILGFLLILPLTLKSIFKGIKKSNDKNFYINLAAISIMGFLISLSALLGFCYWFNRFLITAIVVGAPILAYSYSRKLSFSKIIITLIAIYYYFFTPLNNLSRPFAEVLNVMLYSNNFSEFREDARLRYDKDFKHRTPFWTLINYLKRIAPDNSKIGLVFSEYGYFYPFFEANSTWKIYPLLYDRLLTAKNFNDYDFIIIANERQYMDFSKKKAAYNYLIKGKRLIYHPEKPDDPISLYLDKNENYIDSGLPAFMCNIIDFNRIPKNFKLMRIILPEKQKETRQEFDFNFHVYKKI